MSIGQAIIDGITRRARGRPRIGSVRCNITLSDGAVEAINERRRLTRETRNQAILALIDSAIAKSPHFIDRQGAIALLRASVNAKIKVVSDADEKRTAFRALAAVDMLEEYLRLKDENQTN